MPNNLNTVKLELLREFGQEDNVLYLFVVDNILHNLYYANKGAFQSLILRAIAILLDNKYTDNIRNCQNVWIIDTVGGKIKNISTNGIRKNTWQYFAAFRTQEDAIFAVKILKEFKDMYA